MNITNRKTHDVRQGTGPWLRLRENFNAASEAPAALGVSKYMTRAELLRRKHTGVAPEPDAATHGRFAAGHAAEAKARPLAEAITGSDLYPVTMTVEVDGLHLLASLDGLDICDDPAWETKLWNEELAAAVRQGGDALPEHYAVQLDQEMLVSGANRVLFTCTDGTPERFVSCWYEAKPDRFAALAAGWHRFNADLAAYTLPPAEAPAAVGKAPETLPALRIEVTGQVTASNLAEFKATALAAIQSVNRNLQTDQDFADADKAVKWCGDIETRIKAAKEHALSQTASIDALFKALDDITAEAKRVRLDLDKLVTRRKTERKEEAVAAARKAPDDHIADLNGELAPIRLQPAAVDFPACIKGLRSFASMDDALQTAVANGKIAADAQAKGIRASVATFKAKAEGFEFLFVDLGALVHKAADDFAAVVDQRITVHKAAEAAKEAKRQADEAERITKAEQRAREDEARRISEAQAESARLEALAIANRAARDALLVPGAPDVAHALESVKAAAAPSLAQDLSRPLTDALASKPDAMRHAREAAAAISAARADEPATLTLGAICGRLGFTVTATFLLDVLHIKPAATERGLPRFTESQFRTICHQLRSHVSAMGELYAGEVDDAVRASMAVTPVFGAAQRAS